MAGSASELGWAVGGAVGGTAGERGVVRVEEEEGAVETPELLSLTDCGCLMLALMGLGGGTGLEVLGADDLVGLELNLTFLVIMDDMLAEGGLLFSTTALLGVVVGEVSLPLGVVGEALPSLPVGVTALIF